MVVAAVVVEVVIVAAVVVDVVVGAVVVVLVIFNNALDMVISMLVKPVLK